MMCHVPIHQIQEKDIYHTHWRTHIPMLLNMIKKEFATENLNTRNASVVDQNVKKKEHVAHISWEHGCTNIITQCMLWKTQKK